jgi:plasmid stabilization system protein ParE
MGYRIVFSGQADRDLEAIVRFLAQKNRPAAEHLGHALLNTVFSLREFPHRGSVVLSRPKFRRIVHRPWHLIFFKVDDRNQVVEIARIWDARQDPGLLKLD